MTLEVNERRIECLLRAFDAREYELQRPEPRTDLLESITGILLDEALGHRLRDRSGLDWVWREKHLQGLSDKYRHPRAATVVLELMQQPWYRDEPIRGLQMGHIPIPGSGQRVIIPGR